MTYSVKQVCHCFLVTSRLVNRERNVINQSLLNDSCSNLILPHSNTCNLLLILPWWRRRFVSIKTRNYWITALTMGFKKPGFILTGGQMEFVSGRSLPIRPLQWRFRIFQVVFQLLGLQKKWHSPFQTKRKLTSHAFIEDTQWHFCSNFTPHCFVSVQVILRNISNPLFYRQLHGVDPNIFFRFSLFLYKGF